MRTKPLNNNSSMKLIMENWRKYADAELMTVKLNEEYNKSYALYNRFILLNESEQKRFLIEEEEFSAGEEKWFKSKPAEPTGLRRIIAFVKELAKGVGESWRTLLGIIYNGQQGALWKAFQLLGWSLEAINGVFTAGARALRVLVAAINDVIKKKLIDNTPREVLLKRIKATFKAAGTGKGVKYAIAGFLFLGLLGSVLKMREYPYNPALIGLAFAGQFTADQLFEEDVFIDAIFEAITMGAVHAAFPGVALVGGGFVAALRMISAAYSTAKKAGWTQAIEKKLAAPGTCPGPGCPSVPEEDAKATPQQLAKAAQ